MVITCPACGTENREWASHCGECGKPLPEDAGPRPRADAVDVPRTDRLPGWLRQDAEEQGRTPTPPPGRRGQAMPPIPDGGLAGSMPSWLGGADRETRSAPAPPRHTGQRRDAADETPDVTAFLSPEDLPGWLRRLAESEARVDETPGDPPAAPVVAAAGPLIGDEPVAELPAARHDTETASTRAAPVDSRPREPQPSAQRAEPPHGERPPLSATTPDRRLTAMILAVVAIAAAMIAYAVYLGVAR